MNVLALIPARGGSQRVPGKNVKMLCGKPLLAYTVEAALHAKRVSRTIVSTDCDDIAATGRSFGADVPFMRPASLARSDSTEMQFLEHTLDWLSCNEGYEPDLIVILYPTSPLRKSESIDAAIEKMIRHPEADSLRSVRLCSEHPCKMWTLEGDYLRPFVHSDDPNDHTLSYQLLPTVYIQNASIYITRPVTVKTKRSSTGAVIIPFIMDETESVDVNTPLDFILAETVMNQTSFI